jgi:hypothetical protein
MRVPEVVMFVNELLELDLPKVTTDNRGNGLSIGKETEDFIEELKECYKDGKIDKELEEHIHEIGTDDIALLRDSDESDTEIPYPEGIVAYTFDYH